MEKEKEKNKKAHIATHTLLGPTQLLQKTNKRCVTLCCLPILHYQKYLKQAKEKKKKNYGKLKYLFHHAKIYLIFQKKSSERNQNPSRYYYHNSIITNDLKFQHKPKNIILAMKYIYILLTLRNWSLTNLELCKEAIKRHVPN
jgi:hypothetical protein